MFSMHFETENATFGETEEERLAECARILRAVADAIAKGVATAPITDPNGNKVGRFDCNAIGHRAYMDPRG